MTRSETNFPAGLTRPLLTLLGYLREDFAMGKLTAETFAKGLRRALRRPDMVPLFAGTTPPYWWFHYILRSHEAAFPPSFVAFLRETLVKTRVRSLSGIIPLTLFTNGVGCPFNCAYCPSEPGMPKSYLSDEPAVRRAIRHGFGPYRQTAGRLRMFAYSNHPTDKVEIIIKGGTFSFYPRPYRRRFIRRIFDACNDFGETKTASKNLAEAQERNMTAKTRIIGINVETRPDYINPRELAFLRELGVTHVELGVQAPDDTIYKKIRRGHDVADVARATSLLRDWGFKVGYHLMLNLPGSSPEHDFGMVSQVFADTRFKPDHLKLYPTTVTPFTDLSTWYKNGTYVPYPTEDMKKVILRLKTKIIPPWVRIGRLTRDITTTMMEVPSFPPNLREIVQKKLAEDKGICSCIRCREIKDRLIEQPITMRKIQYDAGDGHEVFLEFVDAKNHLLGFLRLRIPSGESGKDIVPHELLGAAIVRELHVYGQMQELGELHTNAVQHHRLGQRLLAEAERIAGTHAMKRIAVIAGIGARPYYRNLGYTLDGTYMVKPL